LATTACCNVVFHGYFAIHCHAQQSSQLESNPLQILIAADPGTTGWVRLRASITLQQLADDLDISAELLSDSNGLPVTHRLRPNDWVALPQLSRLTLAQVPALDPSVVRSTAPARLPLLDMQAPHFDRSPEGLERMGVITEIEALRLRNNKYASSLGNLVCSGVLTQREGSTFTQRKGSSVVPRLNELERPRLASSSEASFRSNRQNNYLTVDPKPPQLVQPRSADCVAEARLNSRITSADNDLARRLATQRRNLARNRCNEYTAFDESKKRHEDRVGKIAWRTYGNVRIPWGLWKEVSPDKRSNGFIRLSLVNKETLESDAINMINATADHSFAPNGISISCATATISLNVSSSAVSPVWTRRHGSWTAWAPPDEGTEWEKIFMDLCSNVKSI